MSAGQPGLGNATFSSICGTFFLGNPDMHFNMGHMSYLFKMWTKQELQQLTTMQVIDEMFKLNDLKVEYQHHNLNPPKELLADLQLVRHENLSLFSTNRNYSKF